MQITIFDKSNDRHIMQASALLADAFPDAYSTNSYEEILDCLNPERISISAIKDDDLIGFIGGVPQYGVTGWELHPLVVNKKFRGMGIGRKLVEKLEHEISTRGGITIYLGSDDEHFQTSISGTDLYNNIYEKIKNITNFKNHPIGFYLKMGYIVSGVIPDANGFGKPDIIMSKRIVNPDYESSYKKSIQVNEKRKIIDLSKNIRAGMEVFPSDPKVHIDIVRTIDIDGWELRNLNFGSHTGTHADAFSHMLKNGKSIDEIPIDSFFGPAQKVKDILKFPKNTGMVFEMKAKVDLLGSILQLNPPFVAGNIDEKLQRELLSAGIITFTDLVNLEKLPYDKNFIFYGIPLKIHKGDGSPVRAFAVID